MPLPDFAQEISFIRLRQQMGVSSIPTLPKVKFERKTRRRRVVEETDQRDKQLLEKLKSGIEVPGKDIRFDKGFLTYGGRKIVAYIRDQRMMSYDGTSNYRFHLMDCSTMQNMRAKGRERRYVATQRSDGRFEVNYSQRVFFGSTTSPFSRRGDIRKATLKLALCQNCWWELVRRGLYHYHDKESFSLKGFFKQHDSGVARTVRKIEEVEQVQEYQPNQDDLSREYRKAVGYRCQLCQVNCRNEQGLLHLHHVDGDPSNNAHHNLRVLCVDCHANEPLHQHMGRSARDQEKIARIKKLRIQQNLTLIL